MIKDVEALHQVRKGWEGVVKMRARMKLLTAAHIAATSMSTHQTADALNNLPLLLAFDVLGKVLKRLKREGHFTSKHQYVGGLMDDAKSVLIWIDWAELRDGVRRRNAVAHDGQLYPRGQCWKNLDAVENQLKAWGVI